MQTARTASERDTVPGPFSLQPGRAWKSPSPHVVVPFSPWRLQQGGFKALLQISSRLRFLLSHYQYLSLRLTRAPAGPLPPAAGTSEAHRPQPRLALQGCHCPVCVGRRGLCPGHLRESRAPPESRCARGTAACGPRHSGCGSSLNRLNVEIKANLCEKAVFLLSLNLLSGLKFGASPPPPAARGPRGAARLSATGTRGRRGRGARPPAVFCACG